MNERMKDLAEQAGFKILPDGRIIPTLDHNGECGRDLQKFAELIVRECLTFVEPMPGSGDIDDLALEAAHNNIKEHFGVKE